MSDFRLNPTTPIDLVKSLIDLSQTFIFSSALPAQAAKLQPCLKGLSTLPSAWYCNRLDIWVWESRDIFELRELAERWNHAQFWVRDAFEAADLLGLSEEVWLVEIV
ncbi:hypothetical protein [Phormidesmis priestleyi]|uniref:hypothetical protein n=1 Tax=Phormidesmis priestleyi TaxID=268141 RepID=UPI00083B3A44|nr:hypothetical protein [Phormidesmis priestleyi]